MISVEQVDELIGEHVLTLGTEKVSFEQSLGRILKQEVVADRDFPPFNRVMMDGIAIQYSSFANGKSKFEIEGLAAAGSPPMTLKNSANCIEVMTGAVMPANADTVIKYEEVDLVDGHAILKSDIAIKEGQHIHLKGTDRQKGTQLLSSERIITAAEIAVLATVGCDKVEVACLPKIAVIATGDELVDVDMAPKPHQIRKSNVHSLVAALQNKGFKADIYHFLDDKKSLNAGLEGILKHYNVVVLSGGVSKGKLDYVPEILTHLGVNKEFHFVKQRPGKPFWFGRYKTGVVFALPGNPVSTFVGMTRYVLPFLYRNTGILATKAKAVLTEDFSFKPNLTYFLQVKLAYNAEGKLMAMPVPGQGSGDLANLLDADAFLELPADRTDFKKGDVFDCFTYR